MEDIDFKIDVEKVPGITIGCYGSRHKIAMRISSHATLTLSSLLALILHHVALHCITSWCSLFSCCCGTSTAALWCCFFSCCSSTLCFVAAWCLALFFCSAALFFLQHGALCFVLHCAALSVCSTCFCYFVSAFFVFASFSFLQCKALFCHVAFLLCSVVPLSFCSTAHCVLFCVMPQFLFVMSTTMDNVGTHCQNGTGNAWGVCTMLTLWPRLAPKNPSSHLFKKAMWGTNLGLALSSWDVWGQLSHMRTKTKRVMRLLQGVHCPLTFCDLCFFLLSFQIFFD